MDRRRSSSARASQEILEAPPSRPAGRVREKAIGLMTLEELLSSIPVDEVRGAVDVEIRGVAIDSRRVGPRFVFVAAEGARTDGHCFLEEAKRRGAAAVVSERAPQDPDVTWIRTPNARRTAGLLAARLLGEPSKKLALVGVTGTNGKSTTVHLLDAVFAALAPPSAMMGTIVHRVAGETEVARNTTPEGPDVQSFLDRAVRAGCRFGALEVSSHGLALSRLEGTELACGVFTNLSRDHLDFHRDMEDYFAAKRKLFENYRRPGAAAVIGIDGDYGRRLAGSIAAPVVTFGFAAEADVRVESMRASFEGLELKLRDRSVERTVVSPLLGRHNALNLAAAFAAASTLGFDPEAVLSVLAGAPGAPGRYERVETGRGFQVIVDYAHTDDALRQLLETTRAIPHRRILTVFGCGGDRDRTKRPLMGAVAARLSDVVVLTSDNPRGEDPMKIIREIELGTKEPESRAEIRIEPDRRKAIALAVSLAGAEDVVLIAGKGHETYQVIGDRVLDFDDREVVREVTRP